MQRTIMYGGQYDFLCTYLHFSLDTRSGEKTALNDTRDCIQHLQNICFVFYLGIYRFSPSMTINPACITQYICTSIKLLPTPASSPGTP